MNKKKNFNKHLESVNIFSPLTTRSGKIRSLYSTDDIVASDNFNKNSNLTRSESMDFLCNVDFDKTIVVENNDLNEETFIIDKITDEVVGDFEEGEKIESDNDSIFLESDSSSHLIDFTYIDVEYDQYDRSKLLIVPTNKNKPKLCDHGLFYTIEKNKEIVVWRCERTGNQTTAKCPGRAQTKGFNPPVKEMVCHNHEPDLIQEEVYFYLGRLLYRAKNTCEEPRTIIKNSLVGISKEAAKRMPRANALTQRIIRIRQKKVDYGANPGNLHDIEVSLVLQKSLRNENFYFDDSGSDDPSRILIFSTDRNIGYLKSNLDWYGDGTFDVSPLLFKQIFSIQAPINGKVLPLLYSVIPNKEQISYDKLFKMLKVYLPPPNSFSCDFEKAILNSLESNFPDCKVLGCWFHLCQNLWKHMKEYGLAKKENYKLEVYKSFHRLKVLPFVPLRDIYIAFELIKKNSPLEFNRMIEYFENYYIGKLKKNSKSIREEPIFKPKFWNVFDRIEADLPRTNNSLESWHKNFESSCKKHPTVNGLIHQFRLEQNYTDIIIDQLESGDFYEKKKKQLIRDNKIKFLCNNYKSEKILEFIDSLVSNLSN